MALSPGTREAIRRHWAEKLDCPPAAFEESGVTITRWSGRTVRVVRRGAATVAAAPERVGDALTAREEQLGERPLTEVEKVVEHALESRPARVVDAHGPAVLSYVDATAFSPVPTDARLLDDHDRQTFQRFRARIPEEEWSRASPTFRPGQTAGLFRNGQLVAVATLTEPPFPDVGVVVTPNYRGAGLGRQVVSRVADAAFERERDAILRYRTPENESASLALAAALGFERWASETVVGVDR